MDSNRNIEGREWDGKTDGSLWMHKTLIFLFKYVNIRVFYAIMAVVVPFYMAFSHKGYLSIYHFFRYRFNYSVLKSFRHVYLNHYKFGQTILDKFASYAGKSFNFDIEGEDIFNDLVSKDEGFVQLSSHVGNYEMAGYTLNPGRKSVNALVYAKEAEIIMKNRAKLFSNTNMNMIPVKGDMSHIFLMNNALSEGNILSIPADRLFGSTKSISCNFMEESAKFPIGPYIPALQRNLNVISIFVMKESLYNYRIYVKRLNDRSCSDDAGSIKERAKRLADSYVESLESIVRLYPDQWFNYYEFWRQ